LKLPHHTTTKNSAGDRILTSDDTIARVMAHKSAFGITRIANLTGLDRIGIPVVMVCRPNARSSAVFNGKGVDIASAKASGLMEAVETWHAENVCLPLRFASFADLRDEASLVDVDQLPRRPGPDFDPHMPILWVEGRNLMDDRPIWLPFEIVHMDSRMSGPPISGALSMTTNGLASGNSFAEAVRHGLCELIERDATSLWHQSSPGDRDARRLDLATVDDPNALDLIDRLAKAELEVAVWDVTTDVAACAFQCILVDRAGETGHIGVGAACHPRRARALLGAVLEAAQVRTTYIIGAREDIEPYDYDPAILARRNAETRAFTRSTARPLSFKAAANAEFETAESDVGWLVERLRSIGVGQTIAVDLTRPEYGIPVVRMVVPGLEGFNHHPAQYAPGPRARGVRRQNA
jgi:YcaO-like protein with predicted kinase domain